MQMKMLNYFIFIFSVLSLVASVNAETSVMAKCEQKFIVDEVSDVRSYLVLRDGDRLFSKYRESKLSEFTVLDDVTIRKYEGVRLEEFLEREENKELVDSLETPRSRIKEIFFFGVDQKDRPEDYKNPRGEYLFEIWFGKTELSFTKSILVKDKMITKCDGSKSFWSFFRPSLK